ncbi:MAG: PA2778 family cysteine peptidase [Acidiferrobacterales bacterium]|nr:PA2778 family cysteine peptidase [Acidiferrobacterales bacterium]
MQESNATPNGCNKSLILFLLISAVICGCSSIQSGPESPGSHSAIELAHTPFIPQTEYHCGPAALATVLGAEQHSVEADTLARSMYVPDIQGSLQPELLAAARQEGFIPVILPPNFANLIQTLELGKPVIVLQNLGTRGKPYWHYAVLVGYDYEDNRVVLRSGTTYRKDYRNWRFKQTWDWAGNWAVVLLREHEMINSIDQARYLSTLTELEQTQHQLLAHRAYHAARIRWPDSLVVLAGLGNTAYRLGDTTTAEEAFRTLLAMDRGNPVASNNLAHLLLERGCSAHALELIDPIYHTMKKSDALYSSVSTTWHDVQSKISQGEGATCSL